MCEGGIVFVSQYTFIGIFNKRKSYDVELCVTVEYEIM